MNIIRNIRQRITGRNVSEKSTDDSNPFNTFNTFIINEEPIVDPKIWNRLPSEGIAFENLNDALRGIMNSPNQKGVFYKFIKTESDQYYRMKILVTNSKGIYYLPDKVNYTLGPVIIDAFDIPLWLAFPNRKTLEGKIRIIVDKKDPQTVPLLCRIKEFKNI
jgi:hypothetical protein